MAQHAQRVAQALFFVVEDVIVGERAGIDIRRLQHAHGLGVGAEMEPLFGARPLAEVVGQGAFQVDDAQVGLREVRQQVAPHFFRLHVLEALVDQAAEHHISGKDQRQHDHMVFFSSLRSAVSGRVLSTSAFSSQPRRA